MLRYDHYKLLGIGRDASPAQIKRAYRRRVKDCHPDINPSPKAATVFRAVHEAYDVLSDVSKRSRYDKELRYYRQAPPSPPPPTDPKRYSHRRRPMEAPEASPGTVDRYAFFGLHLTGLLFALILVSGILVGITFHDWPVLTLIFTALGLAVIPDSLNGLRYISRNA